jgi:ribosomal protein S27AE
MSTTYKPVPECPQELARIMSAVNALPGDTDEMFEKMSVLIAENDSRDFIENDDYWDYHKTLFQRFESIIGNKNLSQWLTGETDIFQPGVVFKFAALVEAKKVLRYIAETNRDEDSPGLDRLKKYYALEPKDRKPFIKWFFSYDYSEAKLKFEALDHLKFFLSLRKLEGLLNRVKMCPVCDGVFWAKKTNALTCGDKKCIDALQYKKKKLKK